MVCILMLKSPEMQAMSQQGGNLELRHRTSVSDNNNFYLGNCADSSKSTKAAAPVAFCKGGQQPDLQKEVLFLVSSWDLSVQHLAVQRTFLYSKTFHRVCACVNNTPTAILWREGITEPWDPLLAAIKLHNCTSLSDKHHWGFGKSRQ